MTMVASQKVGFVQRAPETNHLFSPNLIFRPSVLEMNEADGSVKLTCLGSNIITENQLLQYTVPPNVWFGAFPTKDINISKNNEAVKNLPRDAENHFSLVGCTCAPAFEFADFELAKHAELVSRFPTYETLISIFILPS